MLKIKRYIRKLFHSQNSNVTKDETTVEERESRRLSSTFSEHVLSRQEIADLHPQSRINVENPSESNGLTTEEAKRRLEKDGRNAPLTSPKKVSNSVLLGRLFLNMFWLLLIAAGVISLITFIFNTTVVLYLYMAFVFFIIAILMFCASFWQKKKARNAVRGLPKLAPTLCSVIRDGRECTISTEELVYGDLVYIHIGARVPADIRILSCNGLKLEISSITDKVEPIDFTYEPAASFVSVFESHNIAFNGSLCIDGEGLGVVIRVADHTVRTDAVTSHTRYLVLLLATLCLSSIWSNILTFNFTVICMSPKHSAHGYGLNNSFDQMSHLGRTGTEREKYNTTMHEMDDTHILSFFNESHIVTTNEFHYSPTTDATLEIDYTPTPNQKSMLIGAVAVGALVSSVPLTYVINVIGARITFASVGFLSAIATALIPAAVRLGFPYFLVLRALQGVGYAACMPVVGGVTAKWATLTENGIFVSMLTAFVQIAPSMTMPLSGKLCVSQYGWPSVYYVHAAYSFVLFTLFALFYQNSPRNHPFVSSTELSKLAVGKPNAAAVKKSQKNVPYKSIFKTMAIWAVWVASIGNFSGYNLISLFSPTYLNKVMGYPVVKTGLSAALPPFFQVCVKMLSGASSDKIRFIPETLKVRIYNSVAYGSFALFMILLAFTPTSHPGLALIFLTCGTSLLGFNTGGFYKSATLVSRHFSQFVMGVVSTIICATMLLVPVIVGFLTDTNSIDEWARVFFVFAGIMIVTNLFFVIFASAKPAWWALEPTSGDKKKGWEVSSSHFTISSVNVIPSEKKDMQTQTAYP